jgi:hypothetical protein
MGTVLESTNRAAGCAPCAGSELTLKEQISKLDDMVLEDGNEGDSNKTNGK